MRPVSLAIAAALLGATLSVATAGARYEDQVYADSFGNLVIHSSGGYKRIIVGAGEAASGYRATGSYYPSKQPRIAYHRGRELHLRAYRDCEFGAVLVKGRSYMYGLPDDVVPTLADALCR